jgi:hypothetical protein
MTPIHVTTDIQLPAGYSEYEIAIPTVILSSPLRQSRTVMSLSAF